MKIKPLRPILSSGVAVLILLLSTPTFAGLSVGIAINDLNNPFFQQIVKGAKRKADQLTDGNAEIMVVSSDYSLALQQFQLRQLVARKADIIVITAADQNKMKTAIEGAIQAGSQVIAVDVSAEGAIATVATDNHKAGVIACDYLAKQINYSGRVAIIGGPSVSAVRDRVAGCESALAEYSSVELAHFQPNGNGTQQGGSDAMKAILEKFADIKGIFAINDPSAIGAELFAKKSVKTDLVITSVDGAPVMQKALAASGAMIRATAAQYPDQMAEKAVQLGYQLMQGKTLEESSFLIEPSLLSQSNLDTFNGWAE